MAQYIPKVALVVEIERLHEKHTSKEYRDEAALVLEDLEDFLGTLEVKEADLEGDVDKILEANDWNYDKIDFYQFATHFFELGMQVSNK